VPDEATETLGRVVAQRSQTVQQTTRIKNRIHGILHTNVIAPDEIELFVAFGRVWRGSLPLERDEMLAVRRYLVDLDQRLADFSILD